MQVKPHLLVSKIMCLKVTHLTGMGGMPGKTLESMRAKPKFDNEHTAKDPAVWKSELQTDESKTKVFGCSNSRYFLSQAKADNNLFIPAVKHNGGNVVWGCSTVSGTMLLIVIDPAMNSVIPHFSTGPEMKDDQMLRHAIMSKKKKPTFSMMFALFSPFLHICWIHNL